MGIGGYKLFMKNNILNICIFILSVFSLLISLKLFYNMGVYVDEYNTNPGIVLGGELWLYMNWIRLGITVVICILSGVNILNIKSRK